VSGLTIRRSGPEDAEAIAEVANALSQSLHGEADVSPDFVRRWFDIPHLAFWVGELDGRVVAHLDIEDRNPQRLAADIRVHPDVWGRGIAGAMLDTAEAWARTRPAASVLQVFPDEGEEELRATAQARGYRPVRHFFRMQIDLQDAPQAPTTPAGIAVRSFDPGRDDPDRVHAAHMESFVEHWGHTPAPLDEWRAFFLEGPHVDVSLWQLAEEGGELAGFSINCWHSSGDPALGHVNVLGVRPAWRRRGIGLALLERTFAEFRRRGARAVGLGVDTENATGAVDLYERAGMSVVRRNATYERAL
jgi:mycothiol synthase